MQISVTFRHMDSSPALRDRAIEKVERLEQYFDQVQDVKMVLSTEKKAHLAEITVISPGNSFTASASSENMYGSLDLVLEKMERHLKKRKELTKLTGHKRNPQSGS